MREKFARPSLESLVTVAEAARRLGTTVKALKVYERAGLVRPRRTASGWRAYGRAELVRLHEILTLKGLGLTLSQIRALIADRRPDLGRTLALQETALQKRRRDLDRMLNRVMEVRARLERGEALAASDLVALAENTASARSHWGETIMRFYRSHLGDERIERLRPGKVEIWASLIGELKALVAADVSPDAPAARDFFQRWVAASREVSQGDEETERRALAAWVEAAADPTCAADLPLGRPQIEYLAKLGSAWGLEESSERGA